MFLGFFFLAIFLVYRYISRRDFYRTLSSPLKSLDDTYRSLDKAPISKALGDLMAAQYSHYKAKTVELENAQEQHRKFMDQWVHQMKTPLSVIELVAHRLDEPDSSNIREETDRLKTGLNTILYMARLRVIEQDFHVKPISLSKLIQDVNRENRRFYIRNEVYPKLDVQMDITVHSDEKWLFFMLSQLIQNAVKYSSGKSGTITIKIYTREKEAVIEVEDKGVGIPASDQRRVFDAFYTGENGRTFRESTGMGLFLTKEAAEQLGHRIELESIAGEGSIFRIVFSQGQYLTPM